MEHAFGGCLTQYLHRCAQSLICLARVCAANGLLRAFDRAMDLSFDRTVAQLALQVETMALDGRRMNWNVWHIETENLTTVTLPVNKGGLPQK